MRRKLAATSRRSISRGGSGKVSNIVESLEETRVARCQRKYLAAWHRLKIDWQQSASFVRPSSKPAVRSAIKPSRSLRDFPPFRAGPEGIREGFTCFPVFEIRHVDGKTERGIIKVFESDKCVSKGGVVGEVLEMSATAGLPSSSKQPDNYGEP